MRSTRMHLSMRAYLNMHGQKVTFQEGPYEFTSEGKAWLFGTNFNYAF